MKLSTNIKLFIIGLLFFVIIFVLLGQFDIFKEGLETPKCTTSDITDEDSNYYTELSTKLITPICPVCPAYEPSNLRGESSHTYSVYDSSGNSSGSSSGSSGGSSYGSTGSGSNNTVKDSGNNNKTTTNTTTDNSSKSDSNYNSTQDILQQSQVNQIDNSTNTSTDSSVTSTQINQDSSVNQDNSKIDTVDSKFSNLLGNNSIMFGSFGGGGSGSNTLTQSAGNTGGSLLGVSSPETVKSDSLTPYDKIKTTDPETISMINEMKATITKLNQQANQTKETCPPCPACERCPEPAFECKKVPNYRSPSIDNYMPVPVLNDFSKF